MSTATSHDVGTRIASRVARAVGPRRYALWFDRSARFDYRDDAGKLSVAVPNRFAADWIDRNFRAELEEAAHEELGEAVTLDLHVAPDRFTDQRSASGQEGAPADAEPAPGTEAAAGVQAKPKRNRKPADPEATRRLRHRLDTFVVGPSNELAHAAACRVADVDAPASGPLFLHGGCGLGKTHLLQGVCRHVLDQQPDARVLYATGEQFTNEYITAVRANKLEAFRRHIRRLDLLAIDDVHFIANKQATQNEFLHSFDQIELGGARVVLASDCHPKLIKQFSEALVSRCVRGLVVQIASPDAETRLRLVQAIARRRELPLEEEGARSLASQCRGSVREIEGALTKLQALASLSAGGSRGRGRHALHEPIGLALVRRLFDHDTERGSRKPARFETVIEVVCDRLGVTRPQVLGPSRHRLVVLARAVTIYLTRELTSMSYPEIATAMGRKNHSTVITAAQRVQRQLDCEQATILPPGVAAATLPDLLAELRQAIARV